jgi:hypothetical protein
MADDAALAALGRALAPDLDVDAALAELAALGLPLAYSPKAVDAVNAAADALQEQSAAVKAADGPTAERRALNARVARLVDARTLIQRLRPASGGDVTVTPGAVEG